MSLARDCRRACRGARTMTGRLLKAGVDEGRGCWLPAARRLPSPLLVPTSSSLSASSWPVSHQQRSLAPHTSTTTHVRKSAESAGISPRAPTPSSGQQSLSTCPNSCARCPARQQGDPSAHGGRTGDKDLIDSHLSHPKWFYQRIPLQSGYYIMLV